MKLLKWCLYLRVVQQLLLRLRQAPWALRLGAGVYSWRQTTFIPVVKFKGVLVKRPFSTWFNVRSNIFKRYFYDRAKPAVVKGRQKIDCIRGIVTKRDSG